MKIKLKYPNLTLKGSLSMSSLPSFALKSVLICVNPRQFLLKSVKSENFFMQNKANFKNAKISLTNYMTKRYEKICSFGHPKNKAKTKPNKAKTNPILTLSNTKQTQIKPNL